ncbi:alpha/beta hydrolase [Scytonema sp. PCC 10023]|uniref:alpha/beta hydrolase n=1 Tax=Scytonema sp. PCC 10023 TaxID=1680591 RepID=UPI0039C6ECEC
MTTQPLSRQQLVQKAIAHVGYYDLHPDISLNFQFNRWVQWLGEASVLEDMQTVAPKIKTYADLRREFLALSEQALDQDRPLPAAYYLRTAEFFVWADDPQKRPMRHRFIQMMRQCYGITGNEQYQIPYQTGFLPAYRFTVQQSKATLVLFGGYDSYIEEFFPIAFFFVEAGYEVVIFEGPGQGGALEDAGLAMVPNWEEPVKIVLDYFGLNDVILMGISLGGGLVIRAAAFEPRVRYVIADDIFCDSFEVLLRSLSATLKAQVEQYLTEQAADPLNTLLNKLMPQSPILDWGIRQGMHIMGTTTPYEFLQAIQAYNTIEISNRIRADVLLLAGSEDHYVPLHQLYRQAEALTNVRLTTRVFTRAEQAQNHVHVGNLGLSLRFIANWLERMIQEQSLLP